MKKNLLLGAAALVSALSFGQAGIITPVKAFDDFKEASEFDELYSVVTDEAIFPCDASTDSAYMGIFTFADGVMTAGSEFSNSIVDPSDTVYKLTQTRNMTEGQLELEIYQGYGSYQPFGILFGSYCDETQPNNEGFFTLDLSNNAMLEFSVEVESYEVGNTSIGTTTTELGVQLKIQVEDINGNSLVYDNTVSNDLPNSWQYELGITGNGTQRGSDFAGANRIDENSGAVKFSYDLKNAITATNNVPDATNNFDYSKVKSVKFTFASAQKDMESDLDGNNAPDYNPYEHTGKYIIKDFKLGGDPVGLSDNAEELSASLYPNPATSKINFTEELENVTVYNAQGVAVFTAAKASTINVSDLESGVYTVQSSKGSKNFVVK